jgi:uncharacterized protein YukE
LFSGEVGTVIAMNVGMIMGDLSPMLICVQDDCIREFAVLNSTNIVKNCGRIITFLIPIHIMDLNRHQIVNCNEAPDGWSKDLNGDRDRLGRYRSNLDGRNKDLNRDRDSLGRYSSNLDGWNKDLNRDRDSLDNLDHNINKMNKSINRADHNKDLLIIGKFVAINSI